MRKSKKERKFGNYQTYRFYKLQKQSINWYDAFMKFLNKSTILKENKEKNFCGKENTTREWRKQSIKWRKKNRTILSELKSQYYMSLETNSENLKNIRCQSFIINFLLVILLPLFFDKA